MGIRVWGNTYVRLALGSLIGLFVVAAPGCSYKTTRNGSGLAPFSVAQSRSLLAGQTGNTYYVSTQGSDSASGSASDPFLTISYAYSRVAAGDTIMVKPGTYTDYTSSYSGLVMD